jgi:hypothetical protein
MSPKDTGHGRRDDAYDVRLQAAELARDRDHPAHVANGDEAAYAAQNYPMSFSKGLRHDPDTGLVADGADFAAFRKAIDHGFVAPFTCAVPVPPATDIGALRRRRWEAPTAGFVHDLQGPDSQAVTMPPAPALDSDECAYEMGEVYEMALLRDVPFASFAARQGVSPDARLTASIARLDAIAPVPSAISARRRVTAANGRLDVQTLFRGSSPGVDKGPYLSQFMLIGNTRLPDSDAPPDGDAQVREGLVRFGAQVIDQRVWVAPPGRDHMICWADWLRVQNGGDVRANATLFDTAVTAPTRRFIATPRDLASYVHDDALYQAYLNACLILLGMGAPLDPGFAALSGSAPVDCACNGPREPNVTGFALFGGPHILSLVTEVATRALKAVRFQKFNLHLRLRPEALAARVARAPAIARRFPGTPLATHVTALAQKLDAVAKAVAARNLAQGGEMTALLPMAFQEGSPMHPSYGAGHATVAGACVTILKAFFDTEAVLVRPGGTGAPVFRRMQPGDVPVAYAPSTNGAALEPFPLDGDPLTLEGELNKLAANIAIGRNMGGVHFYCDYHDSVRMGETVALGILEEQALCYPHDEFRVGLRTFDGNALSIGRAGTVPAPVTV